MKRVIVFASGTKDGGGSGFQKLVENTRTGMFEADIVAVVSSHENGGVRERAECLGIPFIFFPQFKNATADDYQRVVADANVEFVLLSGWLHRTRGLDPRTTINIHPGPLPRFGGKGMYGYHVHEAVLKAHRAGEVKASAVSMHFVTDEYDQGPVFFQYPVEIFPNDTAESLQERVGREEHLWQSKISHLVVCGAISWDGKNSETLIVPRRYRFHRFVSASFHR